MGNPLSTEKTEIDRSTFISHFRDLGEKGAHLACVPRRLKDTRKIKDGRDSGSGEGARSEK